jgi:lipoprotein-anchoring transpeptidase ErfK/SrfK
MILRSFILLGVGAVFACAVPAFAAGTTPAVDQTQTASAATQTVAAVNSGTTKTDAPVVKKPKAKAAAKKTTKKVAKATGKAKKPADDAVEQQEGGFFARLFGGPIKRKSSDDTKTADAKVKAKPVKATKAAAEPAVPIDDDPGLPEIASNSGELRSEQPQQKRDLFASLFGGSSEMRMLPETRALDRVLASKEAKGKFKVRPDFEPQEVDFSGYPSGTIVIDTSAKFLYLVEDSSTARRYAIAVGREGLQFKGSVKVGDKQEWPRWIPTLDMQKREPKHYGQYKDGMNGGTDNPLGARAIYLYDGKHDTHLRIHGTNQPQSIGSAASNGCFRMINDHVIDLYKRVRVGTPVVII